MTLNAEKIILRNKYNSINFERKMYIETFIQNTHTEQDFKLFLRGLKGDEYFFAFEYEHIVFKENLERLKALRK